MVKAVFLDRDGVINELIRYPEHGILDSPLTEGQFHVVKGAGKAIRELQQGGYRVILASNQPGIAKGHMSKQAFQEIRQKMIQELAEEGAHLDGEKYCLHHPEAKIEKYRVECACRKPKPGMLLEAGQEMGIDLSRSWMIGDGLTDIKSGKEAGCRTILIGRMKCELCQWMDEMEMEHPDRVAANLEEAARYILTGE